MKGQFDKRIRNVLLKAEVIDQAKADECRSLQKDDDESFIETLIENQLAEEAAIVSALAQETHLPPIDLEKVEFDEAALGTLTQDMASYYNVLPVSKIGSILTLAVANPFDILKLDDLRTLTECELRPVVSTEVSIGKVISRAYNPSEMDMASFMSSLEGGEAGELELKEDSDDEDLDLASLTSETGDSPVIQLVNQIIYNGIKAGASDIHIEPFEKSIRVRYRVDGVLGEALTPPKKIANAMVSRLKIMSSLDIAERRVPQDGKFQMRVEGRQVDFRVSVLPVVHGEKVVLRILDSTSLNRSLDSLGWEPSALANFKEGLDAAYGMVLVTGPTGSGKSTTLYSAIRELITVEDNITTVEDPVEYQLDGVVQVPVNAKRGMTFAAALRSILRQDPDIVMIGEIRDLETADIAVKAALTGHLVFSTLHTNDAAASITRMVDMGVDSFMVASSLLVCSAQRLLRAICEHCRAPAEDLPPEHLLSIGFKEEDFSDELTLYKPVGCPRCSNGYKGRLAVTEVLAVNDEIRKMVIKGDSAIDIKKFAVDNLGMLTLRRTAILNAIRGRTSVDEVLRMTQGDD
jgi:type IV pilus assembly protein PilB